MSGDVAETAIEVAARLAVATVGELLARATEQERQTIMRHLDAIKARPARDLGPKIDALVDARIRELEAAAAPVITHALPDSREVPRFAASRIDARSIGQATFEAYSAKRGGKNHDGTPTPKWDALTDGVREGWEAGALEAVRVALEARET